MPGIRCEPGDVGPGSRSRNREPRPDARVASLPRLPRSRRGRDIPGVGAASGLSSLRPFAGHCDTSVPSPFSALPLGSARLLLPPISLDGCGRAASGGTRLESLEGGVGPARRGLRWAGRGGRRRCRGGAAAASFARAERAHSVAPWVPSLAAPVGKERRPPAPPLPARLRHCRPPPRALR